jgi:hypothetical protein
MLIWATRVVSTLPDRRLTSTATPAIRSNKIRRSCRIRIRSPHTSRTRRTCTPTSPGTLCPRSRSSSRADNTKPASDTLAGFHFVGAICRRRPSAQPRTIDRESIGADSIPE